MGICSCLLVLSSFSLLPKAFFKLTLYRSLYDVILIAFMKKFDFRDRYNRWLHEIGRLA